jgi:hypothetical protein
MSALGQKQTYAPQKRMSAFPPIATAKADSRKQSCPLYPQEQTCAVQLGMSALGHVWTAPVWQELSARCSIGRCGHVFGLLARFI